MISGRALPGGEHASLVPLRAQLWLWFIGMMVMTLPWHWLGLQGQWRRVANFNYADPIIAGWGPWVIVSFVAGLVLLASALLFVRNLASASAKPAGGDCATALCAGSPSAAPSPRGAQQFRPVERARAYCDAACLRLSHRSVRGRAVTQCHCASPRLGPFQCRSRAHPSPMSSTSRGGCGPPSRCSPLCSAGSCSGS